MKGVWLVMGGALLACSSGGANPSDAGNDSGPGADAATDSGSPTALPVDCRTNKTDKRCASQSDTPPETIGKGPMKNFYAFGGGFVDKANNRLVVAFGCDLCSDKDTGVMGVDLTTGDRTLLSGSINDTITGPLSVGTSDALTSIDDVHVAPNGKWWVLDSNNTGAEMHEIDPATGNRTVLYTQAQFDRTQTPICKDGTTGLQVGWDQEDGTIGLADFVLHSDGKLYLQANGPYGDPSAIVEISQQTCRVVTAYSTTSGLNVGSGPKVGANYGWLTERSGVLVAPLEPDYLHSVDITTGKRTMISSADPSALLGTGDYIGDGFTAVSADGSAIFSTGGLNHVIFGGILSIDPATGNRTKLDPIAGPQSNAYGSNPIPHPTLPGVYIMAGDSMIALFEPATGNSMMLSR